MPNILETYYRGITQQLRAEIDFINSIFKHQGVKDDGNEIILRDLLKKFIPKKYGVGSGTALRHSASKFSSLDGYQNALFTGSIFTISDCMVTN